MELHEEFKLYENMWEPVEAIVFVSHENEWNEETLRKEEALLSKVAKTNPVYTYIVYSVRDVMRFFEPLDRTEVPIMVYTDAEGLMEIERVCAGQPEGIKKDIFDQITLIEEVQRKSIPMDWKDLIAKADKLLEDLCIKSGNDAWDDGDGYWQEEYVEWCNRKLYYTRLADVATLENLCEKYSKKLPNVKFYFYDDEDEEVSEIGYVASRNEN